MVIAGSNDFHDLSPRKRDVTWRQGIFDAIGCTRLELDAGNTKERDLTGAVDMWLRSSRVGEWIWAIYEVLDGVLSEVFKQEAIG
jgi:hypothetical protein